MPNTSSKTVAVALRVPTEAYRIIKRRADKRELTIAHYIRRFIEYDAMRRR